MQYSPKRTVTAEMEEEKAAAYYEELTRNGEGAARFKQGLGFSSSSASSGNEGVPARGSALPSSSSSSSASLSERLAQTPTPSSRRIRSSDRSETSSVRNGMIGNRLGFQREATENRNITCVVLGAEKGMVEREFIGDEAEAEAEKEVTGRRHRRRSKSRSRSRS